MALNSRKFTGPRCRLMLDGRVVLFGSGYSVTEEPIYEEAAVLDNVEVEEHVIVGFRVEGQISRLLAQDSTLKRLGLYPKAGRSPADHLRNILSMPLFTLVVEDSALNAILEQYEGVKLGRRDWNVQPRMIATENMQIHMLRPIDGSEI